MQTQYNIIMQKSLHSKHANAAFKTHKKYSEPVKTILQICKHFIDPYRHYVQNMQTQFKRAKTTNMQTLHLKHAKTLY